jgi:hypothetical protein
MEAAGLPADTVPYALRHSSIVRQLAAGVPVRFVAQIHDTSVAMIERHYSRFITSEVEAAVRAALGAASNRGLCIHRLVAVIAN